MKGFKDHKRGQSFIDHYSEKIEATLIGQHLLLILSKIY